MFPGLFLLCVFPDLFTNNLKNHGDQFRIVGAKHSLDLAAALALTIWTVLHRNNIHTTVIIRIVSQIAVQSVSHLAAMAQSPQVVPNVLPCILVLFDVILSMLSLMTPVKAAMQCRGLRFGLLPPWGLTSQ